MKGAETRGDFPSVARDIIGDLLARVEGESSREMGVWRALGGVDTQLRNTSSMSGSRAIKSLLSSAAPIKACSDAAAVVAAVIRW
jgi:hypothetical protein